MVRTMSSHTFNGTEYAVRVTEDVDGFCDAPVNGMPSLAIMVKLGTKRGLEIAIHEALHASCFSEDEKSVTRRAKEIADFLWKLGFRRRNK